MANIANTTRRQALRSLSIFGLVATVPAHAFTMANSQGPQLEIAIKAYEDALTQFKMLPAGVDDAQWERTADASLDRAQDFFLCPCSNSSDVLRKASYILTSADLMEFASTWDNGAYDILQSFLPGLS